MARGSVLIFPFFAFMNFGAIVAQLGNKKLAKIRIRYFFMCFALKDLAEFFKTKISHYQACIN